MEGGLVWIAAVLQWSPRKHISPWGTVTAGRNASSLEAVTGTMRTAVSRFWASSETRTPTPLSPFIGL